MKPKMWWLKRYSWPHLLARWLMLFATTGYVLLPSTAVWANPVGEQVVGGSATFDRQGSTLTINQATDRLAVNWQDFSIAAGETTHFNMPSSASIALNRVLGGNPSQIYGTLSSNGNIILVNNAGIFVGPGGVVNAASFVGSTLDIDPGQFMAGGAGGFHLHGDSYAPIVNQGNITAEKGDVFLIAQKVENRGTISAPKGRAALVGVGRAADRTEVVLHEVGGSGFAVRVAQLEGESAQGMNGNLPDGEELLNEGDIAAAQAELSASGNIYALAIRNSGTIRAKAVVAQADGTVRLDGGWGDVKNTGTLLAKNAGGEATAAGGKIEITGQNVTASPESIITAAGGRQGGDGGKVKIDSAGTTIVQGKVDVAAPSAGAEGGKVELLGEKVGLFDGAKVDASGGAGGGTVLVGGDYLGGRAPAESLRGLVELEDEAVKNAKATVMASTAEIRADATASGEGGKIILWSDEYTGFYGQLFARGGVEGGDGGFVETSSLNNLQAIGDVTTHALVGQGGLWLLDPLNVRISTAATSGGQPFPLPATGGFTWIPDTVNSTVNVASIISNLNNGDNVVITTAGSQLGGTQGIINELGDITVAADIISAGTGNLTLRADNSVRVDNQIQIAGTVTLTGTAGEVLLGAQVESTGSDVLITGQTNIRVNAGANVSANAAGSGSQTIRLNAIAGAVTVTANLIADNIYLNSATSMDLQGGVTLNGASQISLFSGGSMSISSTVNANGTGNSALSITTGDAGSISISSAVTSAGGFNLESGTNLNINSGATVSMTDASRNFNLVARNGSLQGGGTLFKTENAGSVARFQLIASRDVNLRISTGVGSTVEVDARGDNGNISLSSPNDIRLVTTDGGWALDAPSQESNTQGNISITSDGRIFQNGQGIQSGRNLSLTSNGGVGGSRIVLNGLSDVGSRMNFTATEIDLLGLPELRLYNGGFAETPRGVFFNGAVNSFGVAGAGGLLLKQTSDAITGFGGLVGNLRALSSFESRGGTIEFFAAGASDATPTINVINTGFPASGYVQFDSTNLRLYTDSYFRAQGDMIFGGTITSGLREFEAFASRLSLLDIATIIPTGVAAPNGGQVIFREALGSAVAPLGAVKVTARGQRIPGPGGDPTPKDAQISVLGGIITLPGVNPLNPSSNGSVNLTADGAVVITSTLNTAGGDLGSGSVIGGNVVVTANADGGLGEANENIQLSAGSILSRGGPVRFNGDVYLVGTPSINTTPGNEGGSIYFNGRLDGAGSITLDSGIAPITFNGAVGSLTPSGLVVTASGGIVFESDLTMGGVYNLSAETNSDPATSGVTFRGLIDGNQPLTITSRTGDITFAGEIGSKVPLASLTVNEGGLGSNDRIFLQRNVTTQGTGGISFSKNTVLGFAGISEFSIRTNDGLNVAGGPIRFNEALVPVVDNLIDFTLNAGTGGAIFFGKGLGTFNTAGDPSGAQFKTLTVENGGSVGTADGRTVLVTGSTLPTGSNYAIDLNAQISTTDAGATLRFRAQNEDIRLARGGFLAGERAGAGNNSAGASLRIIADNGDILSIGTINVSGGNNDTAITGGAGYDSGTVFMSASGVIEVSTIQANGGNAVTFGQGGGGLQGSAGKAIDLRAKNIIISGALISNGGDGVTGLGGNGGEINIELVGTPDVLNNGVVWSRTRESFKAGLIYAEGGASEQETGGRGGTVTITANQGFLVSPTRFQLGGGSGRDGEPLLGGAGGSVTITAGAADGDIFFADSTFEITGDGNLTIKAGRNLVLKNRQYLVDLSLDQDPLSSTFGKYLVVDYNQATDELDVGGVVITMNTVADPTAQTLLQNRRGELKLQFSQAANANYVYGTDADGNNLTAGLYIPSNGYIISNGGAVTLEGGAGGFAGDAVLSGIVTSAADVRGGRITINNTVVGTRGNVDVNSALETFGGTPVLPTYGRDGGAVTISGRNINVRRIDTRGSASLATATVPAIGGSGGNVSLTTAGGVITLERDILAGGGQGLGTGDAGGGAGGNISLTGNVTLNTGEAGRTTITLNTQGGLGRQDGEAGQGGNINWSGGLTPGVFQGVETTSDILALNYGSGTVTLGQNNGDRLVLSQLITAADDARSTGTLRIRAEAEIDTLTTFARGYNLEILGGGTIADLFGPLNTGYVRVGTAGLTTTFTTGLNTSAGPTELRLAGTVVTGSVTDTGAENEGIVAGKVVLVGLTTLESNAAPINLGTIDGNFGLRLNAAGGTTAVTGAVGATTEVGTITVLAASTGETSFASTIRAAAVVTEAGTTVEFNDDLTLSGAGTILNGTVTLNNSSFSADNTTAVLTIGGAGAKSMPGTILLTGGPIEFGGAGAYTIAGSVTAAATSPFPIDLTLSGTGNKTFNNVLTVNSITQSASGLATENQAIFSGATAVVTTTSASTFNRQLRLGGGATYNAGASVTVAGGLVLNTGGGSLIGSGNYIINAADRALAATLTTLTLNGSGTKTFTGSVGADPLLGGSLVGFEQLTGSGRVTFQAGVTTSGDSNFRSLVTLGPTFTATGGTTTFTAASTVSAGALTLGGDGAFVFDSSLSSTGLVTTGGSGARTFNLGMTATGLTQGGTGLLTLGGSTALSGDATLILAALESASLTADEIFVDGAVDGEGTTTLGGRLLVLRAGNQLLAQNGTMTIGTTSGVQLNANGSLGGDGNLVVTGAVNGLVANTQSLTLEGLGTKTFSSTLGATTRLASLTQNAGSGTATFNGNISVNNNATFNENVVLGGIGLTSAAGSVTFGSAGTDSLTVGGASSVVTAAGQSVFFNSSVNLNSALTVLTGTATLNQISGTSANLDVTANNLNVIGALQAGAGVVTLAKRDATGTDLQVGGPGNFLTAAEINLISTSGGLTVRAVDNIELLALTTADTDGITGPLRFSTGGDININALVSIPVFGGEANLINNLGNLSTDGFSGLNVKLSNLAYTTTGAFSLTGVTARDGIDISSGGAMTLGGAVNSSAGGITVASGAGITSGAALQAAGTLSMASGGNIRLNGSLAGAAIRLDPTGNLVATGATFASPDIRAVTQDYFAFFPASAGIAGTQLVIGATSLAQLGANQIGVALPLLSGAGGPYITEFTTGTGQPYILATQNNAVPQVLMPVAIQTAGAFPRSPSFTAEEVEMMTPAERASFEASRRQQAARVMLERQGGQAQEIGLPSEGEIPQARAPAATPAAPTAQVFLDGKPLVSRQGPATRDSTKILRSSVRAVALRSDLDSQKILEGERFVAELEIGAVPIAGAR